jgi:hypothetical protein
MRGAFMASMAISGISSSNATQSPSTVKTATPQSTTTEDSSATLKPDTVKLSTAAQAKLMHREGQSPSVIAATLGTNVAAIDGYLNIKVTVSTATTATSTAQAEPAAQTTSTAQAATTTQTTPTAQAATTTQTTPTAQANPAAPTEA